MPKWPSSTATPALPVYPYSLYGVPVIGGICALVDEGEQVIMLVRLKPADSRLVFPATRPVGSLGSAADEAPSPPGAVEPARRPPIRAAELALVPPAEVTAAPETVHQHRKSRLIGYALTLAMPLAVVELVRRAPLPAAWAISITAAVVACATGWRLLRSGVRWNAGGVAATGIWTSVAAAWPQIGAITVDDDMVNIADTSGQMATITAQRRRGGRTAQSLRAGLEHARSRYTPGVPQPGLQRAPRPWALILVAPLPVAVLMAFHLLSQV
jgi:hypothetical protein